MSKVLVDPAALEEAAKWLEAHSSSSGSAEAFAADALREAIAQPAEAEGVVAWAPSTALEKLRNRHNNAPCVLTDGPAEFNDVPLVPLAALSAERARADVAVADANDAERALVAVTAERDRLQSQLAEAQANDRTAMGYLHDVRQLVGGSDFPEMVRNVARMADALPGCVELIETLSPFEGDVLRKAYAALAAKEA